MPEKKPLIRYTNRSFNSIKADLEEHARRYYPDNFKDFSENSFGSYVLDTVAYVGDMLSFYVDYQANESFLETAIEYDNILRLGEQVGYKQPLRSNSFGVVTMYILSPVLIDNPSFIKSNWFKAGKLLIFSLTRSDIFEYISKTSYIP